MDKLDVTTLKTLDAAKKKEALTRLRASRNLKYAPEYADLLEAADAPADEVAYARTRAGKPAVDSSLTVAQLLTLAGEWGITVPPNTQKDAIIALLKAAQ